MMSSLSFLAIECYMVGKCLCAIDCKLCSEKKDFRLLSELVLVFAGGAILNNKIVKLYAAYRSGCLGDNIFHAYYPLLASIISEENWDIVHEMQVYVKFKDKYDISLPLNCVRQILGVGVEKKEIIYDRGEYIAQKEKLKSYSIDNEDFDLYWKQMMDGFNSYCQDYDVDLNEIDVESKILRFLDVYDEAIVSNDELNIAAESNTFNYIWNNYLKYLSEKNVKLFDFVAAISFSNIQKETMFFSNGSSEVLETYNGLNVYLDSPMIFALLGMDSDARIDSCKMLIAGMREAGCSVQVFDHNFSEIEGIMGRAAGWATSVNYDISKANNVARFFHDVLTDAPAIAEFCENTQAQLNEMGITIKNTSYDVVENKFQEDENNLYAMIEERYTQDGKAISEERKQSIMIDIRSITMAYRERQGLVSTRIQTCGHVVVTLNGTLANVSKNFESNRSINSGHVPACISADLFGSILWLFSPQKKIEYQRKQLLADCYVALRPSKEMLEKYIDSLNMARNADEIDEKKFLFMRAHKAVNDALMNVTKGDYARFNDQTYREVFDEIKAIANKKYEDEVFAHIQTKGRLDKIEKTNEQLHSEIDSLQALINARTQADFQKKCSRCGWVLTVIIFGIPYFLIITTIEILKSRYSEFDFFAMTYVGTFVLASFLTVSLFNRGKRWCFNKCLHHFQKDSEENPPLGSDLHN